MTDCSNVDVRDRLPDLLHDRLGAATRAAVLAHVAECADCADELALLRQARQVLARAPQVDVARIVAALPAPPRAAAPLVVSRGAAPRAAGTRDAVVGRPAAWRRYAVAASLLLAAGAGGFGWLQASRDDAAPTPAVASAADVATGDESSRLLAVNVVGLSEDELAGLLDGLDDLDALPASEPLPSVPSVPAEVPAGGD